MTDNGKEMEVLKVVYVNGSIDITFGTENTAYLSDAIRRASLMVDNMIMANQMQKEAENKSSIIKATDIVNRLKGEKK